MRGHKFILTAIILLCCPIVLLAADPAITWEKTTHGWEATVSYTSEVGSEGGIVVESFIGDMTFNGGESDKAQVTIVYTFDTKSEEKAQERLDEIIVKFTEKNNELILKKASNKARWFSWDKYDLHRIYLQASIPQKFNVFASTSGGDVEVNGTTGTTDISTSGGDVELRNLNGRIDASTSGGDIDVEYVEGQIDISTSGGDINADNVKGDTEVSTSGGNLHLTNIEGELEGSTSGGNIYASDIKAPEATLSTSGGNVQVSKLVVEGFCELSTSGGNIKMMDTAGDIEASTSGGKIRAMVHTGDIELTTSAGDIIADEITGAIEASTSVGNLSVVHLGFGDSKMPKIELETSMGNVKLSIPENIQADLSAEINTPGGEIRSDFDIDIHYSRHSHEVTAHDELNGGGSPIDIITSGGDIIIKKI